jgi:hypothetical protein
LRLLRGITAVLLALSLPSSLVLAQTLGELADKTKKKRKGGAPTYSDADLKDRQATPSGAAGAPGAGGAPAVQDRSGGGEGRSGGDGVPGDSGGSGSGDEGAGRRSGARNDENYWRGQAAQLRAAMKTAEQRIAAAQSRINALMSDAVPTNVGDPFQQQTLEAERVKARQELADAERELELAEDAYTEFEEEARRQAVPPGWVEER